jgi:hypothetical protein
VSSDVPTSAFHCVDEKLIAAPPGQCFALLRRIREYGRWWRLVGIEPVRGGELLEVGSEFDFVGRRSAGRAVRWRCAVRGLTPPVEAVNDAPGSPARREAQLTARGDGLGRIDLEYTEGDLTGPTGWEIEPAPGKGGTLVRYVYRGVRPMSPESARTFIAHGTRFHSHAMQHDALAGIARLLGGPGNELSDEAWDARIHAAMSRFVP